MSFTYKRIINYYETDRMGVVHHSNYIRFIEKARCRWLEELDIPMEWMEAEGITIPTLEVNIKYKHHVTSGDVIIITPKIAEFNGVRMTVEYDVIDERSGKHIIETWTKHCFTDRNLRPINVKKKSEKIYNAFEKLHEEYKTKQVAE